MRRLTTIALAALMAVGCMQREGATSMATGDLLFIADNEGMGAAIEASTGSLTHVGIVVETDSGRYIYEALPRKGVIKRRWEECRQDWTSGHVRRGEPTVAFDTIRLVELLEQHLGQPYDDYFMPDNGRTYCSELVEECYYDKSGNRLFEGAPMNFRAADGSMPEYWARWFDSLGVAVPEGMPGTNPTDLYNSPKIRAIESR